MSKRYRVGLAFLIVFFCCVPSVDLTQIGGVHFRLYEALAILLFVIEFPRYFFRKRKMQTTLRMVQLESLFLLSCLLSILVAVYPQVAIKQSLLLIVFFVVGFSLSESTENAHDLDVLFAAMALGSFVAYLAGYMQLLFPYGVGRYTLLNPYYSLQYSGFFFRPQSFFAEGNEFGVFIVFSCSFFLAAYFNSPKVWIKRTAMLLLLLVLPVFLLNDSRGSIIAFVVIVVLARVFRKSRAGGSNRKAKSGLLRLLIIVSLGFAVGVVLLSPLVPTFGDLTPVEWVSRRFAEMATGGDMTLLARLIVMREGLSAFFKHPLFGIGFGNVFSVISQFGAVPVYSAMGGVISRGNSTTANFIVDILAELGAFGFLTFSALCYYMFRLAKDSFSKLRFHESYYFLSGAFLSLLGVLINSLSYDAIYTPYFWITVGLIVGAHRVVSENDNYHRNLGS